MTAYLRLFLHWFPSFPYPLLLLTAGIPGKDNTVAEILFFLLERLPVLRAYPRFEREFEDGSEDRPISVCRLHETLPKRAEPPPSFSLLQSFSFCLESV